MTQKDKDSGVMDAVDIVRALGLIVVLGAIFIFIADNVVTTTNLQTTNVSATGALTFTGNVTPGETVTINGYVFQFSTIVNGPEVPSNYINISLVSGYNSSVRASGNLTDAINNNATVVAIVTAVNTTNTTTLTAVPIGTLGNSITTTENMTNGSWAAATLTGGLDASRLAPTQTNILSAGATGSSFVIILIIAFIGGIAISYLTLFGGGRRR